MLARAATFASLILVVACSGSHAREPLPVENPGLTPNPTPIAGSETPPTMEAPPAPVATPVVSQDAGPTAAVIADAKAKTVAKWGEPSRAAIERGVDQVATLWRTSDGDLAAFCVEQFTPDGPARELLFTRLQNLFEQIKGHVLELGRSARWDVEVDTGPEQPVDALMASYDSETHVADDMFTTKIAFATLLNFPLTTLADRIRDGAKYSRRQWAEVRLGDKFDARVPSALMQARTQASVNAEAYIAGYNLWMHHVLGADGQRRFPIGKHLISHWNLRDELKANYADKDGIEKQRTIVAVMQRIVTQTIPQAVIDNPRLDWDPITNKVTVPPAAEIEKDAPADRATTAPTGDAGADGNREMDRRAELVLAHFHAAQAIDKFSPTAPTELDRAFTAAEMPQERVRGMLVEILESPLATQAAAEITKTLGRKLEPEDLWYEFGAAPTPEAELDAITRKKYPTAAAYYADMPRMLQALGFTAARAKYLTDHIAVDPSRGAGHAMGAERRGDKAHLRTRVEAHGMDYKGYNIAVHEMGHNVEQTFSLYDIDYTLLAGVPNTAFTEALAFLFQERDRTLLGRTKKEDPAAKRLEVLDSFWNTREIAGSALVEIDVWNWLYQHPTATAAELRATTVKIAEDTWAKYYAPLLGGQDVALLGIYSHTIADPLYLFNYVLGHLIAFQMEEHVAGKDKATFAKEYERVARLGRILPDLWMQQATGKPVTTQPLLDATAKALSTK